jgi:uncharacterized protein (TIGR02246 family)
MLFFAMLNQEAPMSMPLRAFLLMSIACFPLASQAQDAKTIQQLNDKFSQAFAKGDFAAVANLYTEDAILLPPGADIVNAGRTGIESFWAGAVMQASELKLATQSVKALGSDAAQEVGTFTLKTKGQQPQEVAGKYVVIWQKVGSEWKIATDIWNTNE